LSSKNLSKFTAKFWLGSYHKLLKILSILHGMDDSEQNAAIIEQKFSNKFSQIQQNILGISLT
jgi:hypothetical protein